MGALNVQNQLFHVFFSIVGIEIKRLVHIADFQVNPSSRNLSSKLKSGPNYPVWRYAMKIGKNLKFLLIVRTVKILIHKEKWLFSTSQVFVIYPTRSFFWLCVTQYVKDPQF
jgi:hypothetical protein